MVVLFFQDTAWPSYVQHGAHHGWAIMPGLETFDSTPSAARVEVGYAGASGFPALQTLDWGFGRSVDPNCRLGPNPVKSGVSLGPSICWATA
jgi:hypothetical protein